MNILNGTPNYMRWMIRANQQINREAFQFREATCSNARIIDERCSRLFSSFIMLSLNGEMEIASRNVIPFVDNRWLCVSCLSTFYFIYRRVRVISRILFVYKGHGTQKKILKQVSSKGTNSLNLLPPTFCLKFLIDRFAYLSFSVCHGSKRKYILQKGIKGQRISCYKRKKRLSYLPLLSLRDIKYYHKCNNGTS